jgi:hypothetical protein
LTIFDDKLVDVVVIRVSFAKLIGSKLRYYHTRSFANIASTKLR